MPADAPRVKAPPKWRVVFESEHGTAERTVDVRDGRDTAAVTEAGNVFRMWVREHMADGCRAFIVTIHPHEVCDHE